MHEAACSVCVDAAAAELEVVDSAWWSPQRREDGGGSAPLV